MLGGVNPGNYSEIDLFAKDGQIETGQAEQNSKLYNWLREKGIIGTEAHRIANDINNDTLFKSNYETLTKEQLLEKYPKKEQGVGGKKRRKTQSKKRIKNVLKT